MDWNVFFSTISQTSGAIVGIFAAFLITKIIAIQTEHSKVKEKINIFLSKSKTLVLESDIRNFEEYNKCFAKEECKKIAEIYEKTKIILSDEEYYEKLKFSPYQSKDESMSYIRMALVELQKNIDEEKERYNSYNRGLGFDSRILEIQNKVMNSFTPINVTNFLKEENELIKSLKVKVITNIHESELIVNEMASERNGRFLVTISIIAVLLLFYMGVVYPLTFLPLNVNQEVNLSLAILLDSILSIKGFFLGLISFVFSGLMLVFLYINISLRHDEGTVGMLMYYSKMKSYTNFFCNII